MKNKGFTLIELMIVVAILGILAAIIIPAVTNATDDRQLICRNANGDQTLNVPAKGARFEVDVLVVDGVRHKMSAGETCNYVTTLERR